MSIAKKLRAFIEAGHHRIGQVEIIRDHACAAYVLCHHQDLETARSPDLTGLTVHQGPDAARDISTYAEDGSYRFAKAGLNLKRGWALKLDDDEQLRQALDLLYPAAVALYRAQLDGTLRVQHMRDKLGRQTGMYKFAGNISDAGAQDLIQRLCGPGHQCAKRILWQLDEHTPLADSEASRFRGICGDIDESEAIPLLCREACNHFVAEARKVSKKEFEAAQG